LTVVVWVGSSELTKAGYWVEQMADSKADDSAVHWVVHWDDGSAEHLVGLKGELPVVLLVAVRAVHLDKWKADL
jgi:hypothetical protein